MKKIPKIAVASSFESNVEITDARAQKGPILKEYIESLGYTMDEVMVLGDSLNDYSMMSMDFGATVAMGNAVSELKKRQNILRSQMMSLVLRMPFGNC